MNKYIYILISLIIAIIIGILIFFGGNSSSVISNDDFIYIGLFDESVVDDENYVFKDYNDFYNKFKSDKLTKNDFQNNNYALVTVVYNSCSESEITPTSYIINGNDINVLMKYKASCGVCAPEYMYYLLRVDKNIISANVDIKYEAINKPDCDPNVSYKPLIYLYPKEETNVIVRLGNSDLLTTTYPKYENEWNVIAKPNGDLIGESGRTYYGLYWEGFNHIQNDFSDGFVVSRDQLVQFLEEKLLILGLNEREANEFIIYWLPKLEENEYNLIRFEDINIINKQMPLDINPAPDTIIRVFMEYKPLEEKIDVKEQKLVSLNRKGFTVVEWGGTLIK